MNKTSNICVLGSNGFVGKNLINRLNNDKYENVYAINREKLNLLETEKVNEFFNANCFDYVFICSAIVGGIQANINNPYKFLYENLVIQNNVINTCTKTRIKNVLFLGSSCIYPRNYKQPLKEEYLLQAPLESTNEGYAIAKIAGLKLCEYANKLSDTRFISLMPCNLYGPGDNYNSETSHVVASLIRKVHEAKLFGNEDIKIFGDGKPRREFMYVDDLVDGMIWAMKNYNEIESFLNIGTGKDHTITELAMAVCEAFGCDLKFKYDATKPNGMMKKCLDVSKITRLGWKHKYDLKTGLKNTVKHYIGNKNV